MSLTLITILFFKGIIAGFLIAAPVGPIGILCIRRTLAGSYVLGVATGVGAGLADTFYGTVAAFSIASVSDFIKSHDFYLHLFGGIALLWIGFSIWRSHIGENTSKNENGESLLNGFTSAFFLTVSNPVTLIAFAAAFAAMDVSTANDSVTQALALVVGVLVGANSWWLTLCTGVRLMHNKLTETHLDWINKGSGIMLIGFAAYLLLSLL